MSDTGHLNKKNEFSNVICYHVHCIHSEFSKNGIVFRLIVFKIKYVCENKVIVINISPC